MVDVVVVVELVVVVVDVVVVVELVVVVVDVVVVGGTTLPPVRLPALIVSARKVPSIVAFRRLSCAFWFGAHRNARTRVLACAPRATRHVAPRVEGSCTVCVPSMLDPRSFTRNLRSSGSRSGLTIEFSRTLTRPATKTVLGAATRANPCWLTVKLHTT